MGPELVTLFGDDNGSFSPINDDVFCGDIDGENNQVQVLGYEDISPMLGSIESFFNKVKGSLQSGYALQTPKGTLAISDKGLQYTSKDSGGPSGRGNLPILAPSQQGLMNIVKQPIVLVSVAAIILLLILSKKKYKR